MVAVRCPGRLEFVSRTPTVRRERGTHHGFSRELAGCEQFIRPHRRVLKQRGGARKKVLHVHKPEQIKRQRTRRRPPSYFYGTNHCIVQKCWPPQCTFSKPVPTRDIKTTRVLCLAIRSVQAPDVSASPSLHERLLVFMKATLLGIGQGSAQFFTQLHLRCVRRQPPWLNTKQIMSSARIRLQSEHPPRMLGDPYGGDAERSEVGGWVGLVWDSQGGKRFSEGERKEAYLRQDGGL